MAHDVALQRSPGCNLGSRLKRRIVRQEADPKVLERGIENFGTARDRLSHIERAGSKRRSNQEEMLARVETIQAKNYALLQRGGAAIVDLIDAIVDAKAEGANDSELELARSFQRKAQWRLDYVAAENSMGFHAPQEAARLLGEATDYARQGQLAAVQRTLAPAAEAKTP